MTNLLRHAPACLSLVAAVLLAVAPLGAQVVRLPAVESAENVYPGKQLLYPESPAEVFQAPGESGPPPQLSPSAKQESELPADARPGMFQKLLFDATWLGRTAGSRGMGMYDLESKVVLAMPCPTPDSPLLITPGFGVHYMDGPEAVAMPPRLYDAYCQFRWLHRFSPQWGCDLAIAPSVFSDFEQSSSEAFRLTGHAVAAWTWTPTTKVIFGVGYFNRLDVKVLPVGGIIWTPSEDVQFDLLFPRPRLARRVYWDRTAERHVQDWIYLAGEFGGGTWAIERPGAEPDLLDIKDYRVLLGFEHKVVGGLDARVEVGYVFGRRIQYKNGDPEFEPSDTMLLRGGLMY